jgi:hypothetical protein
VTACRFTLALSGLLLAASLGGAQRTPYGGYLYPAGGRQGTTFQATLGGQNLQGVSAALVTGQGVSVEISEFVRPLNQKQINDVGMHLRGLIRQRLAEAVGRGGQAAAAPKTAPGGEPLPELPDHPWLRGLEKMSLEQLQDLRNLLYDPKRQPNAQIAEMVFLKVKVDPQAAPGIREIRFLATQGLTNPMRFEVGLLPEIVEKEPNDLPPKAQGPVDLPVLLNGQIMPGDTDHFRFRARRGQKLVITTQARALLPYLADAVPGWFQATLSLLDATGREVAFADDYRFDPDPVLKYEVPSDGEYVLAIRDSIYRGREDFVYRVAVGELPFVTGLFPLGGTAGEALSLQLTGWNLPQNQVAVAPVAHPEGLQQVFWRWPSGMSNTVNYAVDSLPENLEIEPNNGLKDAYRVKLPQIINGHLQRAGDVDCFRFEAQAGDEIVAEVMARRLGSPVDSLLRLLDARGQVLAWNDDTPDKASGWLTHQADSYLRFKLPQTGTYVVQLSDAQQRGGSDYAYRLRLSAPRPDFLLRVTPSSLTIPAGRQVPCTVHAVRRDGFTGDIEIGLTTGATGFSLSGGRLPAGRDQVQMTLAAPVEALRDPVSVRLEGRATLNGQIVTRPVSPAEDMMQAFAYRHLVPAERLLVMVPTGPRWTPRFALAQPQTQKLPAGGTATVLFKSPFNTLPKGLSFELQNAPEGLTLQEFKTGPEGLSLVFKVSGDALKPGYADNLLIEAMMETETKRPDGKTVRWRGSLGVLPALSYEITSR